MQIKSSVLKLFSYKMCLNFINISYIYEILSAYGACYLVVAAPEKLLFSASLITLLSRALPKPFLNSSGSI